MSATTDPATQSLAETSDETLLRTYEDLGREIRRFIEYRGRHSVVAKMLERRRSQRDLVQAEILRRMGGAR